ncbi:MAG: 50S ribosomal protein L4 [Clostridia bacterium]|nr:50S ribosomal protein L4 [Clostridia bacterium]
MATVKVVNMKGEEVGSIELLNSIFAVDVNEAVLHAATRAYLMNQRQGTQSTLTRTEVSGGGKKPWRQKGTGRARQGSTRAPQWTHGGIAFGPKPRSYRTGMNKKTKRVALYSALSAKLAAGNVIVVDKIETETFSTKTMVNMLKAVGAEKKSLVVLPEVNKMVVKSFDNIPGVVTSLYNTINVYDILNADKFIITEAAVKMLQEVYA